MNSKYNQRRGQDFSATHLNFYEFPSDDPDEIEIWCYTDRFSYQPGDTVSFHASTRASEYSIELVRDGAEPTSEYRSGKLPGAYHPTPQDCYASGCGWPVAHQWQIPADLNSGRLPVISQNGPRHRR